MMTTWSEADIVGPEGEDWRVPVSELEARLTLLSSLLAEAGIGGAIIQHPVDLYYYAGGRQNGSLFVPAKGTSATCELGGDGPTFFVRRSLRRAIFEAGGNDAPLNVCSFPSMQGFAQHLKDMGAQGTIGLQHGEIPASIYIFFNEKLSLFGQCPDITALVHGQREIKSPWEIEMLEAGAVIQLKMFDAVAEVGAEGVTELELVAAAEAVSRAEGYGGSVQMRRFPMQCDRGVIIAGRAGGIPSFFDSALGGVGAHPLSSMGSGFNKIKANETVLVDLLHIHRGYVVDATRMFVAGHLDEKWHSRLEDILAVKDTVVDVLGSGETCQQAWRQGLALADEFGHKDHLMGMNPDQSKFLGHSVGLQLDETPVVAEGFDRPLPIGGTMAIEPKLVYSDGSIGSEDTWIRDEDGMRPLTADRAIPWLTEW